MDVIGLGAGTVDALHHSGYKVIEINSSGKPPVYKKFKFNNLRSYMWWLLREDIKDNNIGILVNDKKLLGDIANIKYKIGSDKMITVESKKEFKKRMKRSPDAGDAFVYANYMRHYKNSGNKFRYISIEKRRQWR